MFKVNLQDTLEAACGSDDSGINWLAAADERS